MKYYLFFASFVISLFIPFYTFAIERNLSYTPRIHLCKHSIHYIDQDLFIDIHNGVPHEGVIVLFDVRGNRMKVLRDSSRLIPTMHWFENVNERNEPANPFFSLWIYGNSYLDVESLRYRLASAEILNCMCPYEVYAAYDAIGILYQCLERHLQRNPYLLFRIRFFR